MSGRRGLLMPARAANRGNARRSGGGLHRPGEPGPGAGENLPGQADPIRTRRSSGCAATTGTPDPPGVRRLVQARVRPVPAEPGPERDHADPGDQVRGPAEERRRHPDGGRRDGGADHPPRRRHVRAGRGRRRLLPAGAAAARVREVGGRGRHQGVGQLAAGRGVSEYKYWGTIVAAVNRRCGPRSGPSSTSTTRGGWWSRPWRRRPTTSATGSWLKSRMLALDPSFDEATTGPAASGCCSAGCRTWSRSSRAGRPRTCWSAWSVPGRPGGAEEPGGQAKHGGQDGTAAKDTGQRTTGPRPRPRAPTQKTQGGTTRRRKGAANRPRRPDRRPHGRSAPRATRRAARPPGPAGGPAQEHQATSCLNVHFINGRSAVILVIVTADLSRVPPGVDPTNPSPARMYDYVLGGKHNFPVDRAAVERIRANSPTWRTRRG